MFHIFYLGSLRLKESIRFCSTLTPSLHLNRAPIYSRRLFSTSKMIDGNTAEEKFSKLPELAKPTLYTIHLKPDLTTFKCEGRETIALEVCFFLWT